MQLAITDNLGQHYNVQGNSGSDQADGFYSEWSDHMSTFNSQATSLIIISMMHLYSSEGEIQKKKDMALIVVDLQ